MIFEVIPTKLFLSQLENLDIKSKRVVSSKIDMLRTSPFRFKKIHSKKFSKVFRIRLNFSGCETRLIYIIVGSKVILVCFIGRDKGYKDLEKYLNDL